MSGGEGFWKSSEIDVKKGGTAVGTRGGVNFIEGANVTLTVVDDAANDEVDVTVAATSSSVAAFRGARVYRSAALNLANTTETAIVLDAESFDTNALHDNVTNNSRIVLDTVGYWDVFGQIAFPASSSTTVLWQASINLNGTAYARGRQAAQNQTTTRQVRAVVQATAATDYVELFGFQNTGGAVALQVGSTFTFLEAHFLGA